MWGVRECVRVCESVREVRECGVVCVSVCMGVRGCVQVWEGVHGYAWVCVFRISSGE